jgi:hypothetical protein
MTQQNGIITVKCEKEPCPLIKLLGLEIFEKFYPLNLFPNRECFHHFEGNCHFSQTRPKETGDSIQHDSIPNRYFLMGEITCDLCHTNKGSLYWGLVDSKGVGTKIVCQKCEPTVNLDKYLVKERFIEFSYAYLHRHTELTLWKAGSFHMNETIFSDITIWESHLIDSLKELKHINQVLNSFTKQAKLLTAFNERFMKRADIQGAIEEYNSIAKQAASLQVKFKSFSKFAKYVDSVLK